jgi:uncharacterized protein (DUF4213/DUF364 family)
MNALDDLLTSLGDRDGPVRDVRLCIRITAVRGTRLGLAYAFPRDHRGHAHETWPGPRGLREQTLRGLTALARSADLEQASVGVAAINTLLEPPPVVETGHAFDLILARGRDKNVVVVGHFPFVERLRTHVRSLSVLELAPRDGDLPATEAPRVIPAADVVAITATTLINHTLDDLLAMARGSYVVLLGPTAPLSPVFFDHGVDAVCGSVVIDPEAALRSISEGEGFRTMRGLRRVNYLAAPRA